MPSLQVVDLSPRPRTEETSLEKTVGAFSKRHRENQLEQQETDALKDIYGKYQQDGKNLEDAIMAIQTRPGISPTTRVNSVKQLMEFQKHNGELQRKAQLDAERAEKKIAEENKETRMQQERDTKKANEAVIAKDLEDKRNFTPEQAAAYASNPALIDKVYPKEPKKNQASQPINPDQLKRIQHVENLPEFKTATNAEKKKMFRDRGVSKENTDSVLDPYIQQEKIDNKRGMILTEKQANADFAFAEEQTAKIPLILSKQRDFDEANVLNEQGVTGKLWDQAMNKAGLVQFTSEGHRVFTSIAKDIIKHTGIKDVIGSQISQQEFKFFTDATINPNFSKEANRRIIQKDQIALRYDKLYADITKSLIEQNEGLPPERLQQKVNDEFIIQKKGLNEELANTRKEYKIIQNVPKGKVLMYDKKRRPFHVPSNQVEEAVKLGATLS